eukprot:SAG31_NODE_2922_length_4906_cov_8.279800_5_plen_343_part_01
MPPHLPQALPALALQGDTFSISALHLSIKVPYFSNSGHKNEKVTTLTESRIQFSAPWSATSLEGEGNCAAGWTCQQVLNTSEHLRIPQDSSGYLYRISQNISDRHSCALRALRLPLGGLGTAGADVSARSAAASAERAARNRGRAVVAHGGGGGPVLRERLRGGHGGHGVDEGAGGAGGVGQSGGGRGLAAPTVRGRAGVGVQYCSGILLRCVFLAFEWHCALAARRRRRQVGGGRAGGAKEGRGGCFSHPRAPRTGWWKPPPRLAAISTLIAVFSISLCPAAAAAAAAAAVSTIASLGATAGCTFSMAPPVARRVAVGALHCACHRRPGERPGNSSAGGAGG